ncbi:cytochrome b5 domain-containing protein 1 [Stomoxys calcitrans]|uniref:cytochrome b5 domain-containing protein 1 n=1 Tax=Stomoxys calcitrans TaxID=35570 RepID=UPI0027E279C4|nr:cytochrome b5 domain-containing protein 1 [Stomoxys calcitrans]
MRYYRYDEVCLHNKKEDFWVVIHGNVFDLTPMLRDRQETWNKNLDYLLAFGGKDLSHFFHLNHTPKTEVSGSSGIRRVLFPPILESAHSAHCKTHNKIWSQDPCYHIGCVTKRERQIRIINTLTGTVVNMKVCDEDSIYDIQRKYKEFYNFHAGSYLWRKFSYGGHCPGELVLHETLAGNGLIVEESDIELPVPSIWLYYTDDLTVA